MPQFGSPWSPEKRAYLEGLKPWFDGEGPPPLRPDDPLKPYRDAASDEPKTLISMRVEGWLLKLVKEMGKQHEMPYQQLLRIWMHEGLGRAILEGDESARA